MSRQHPWLLLKHPYHLPIALTLLILCNCGAVESLQCKEGSACTLTADAGDDIVSHALEMVQLDGSSSNNPEGGALQYQWRQLHGDAVTMDTTSATPSFLAPDIESTLLFELIVTDENNVSTSDQVEVSVLQYSGDRATLDGFQLNYAVRTDHSANDMTIVDNIAYIADSRSGLTIVNLKDPTRLEPRSVALGDVASSVIIHNRTAYVTDGDNGLALVNIDDPRNPGVPFHIDTGGYAEDVAVISGAALVANREGLAIIRFGTSGKPKATQVDTPGSARQVLPHGDVAYVADSNEGIAVINTSQPTLRSVINVATHFEMKLAGDFLYIPGDTDGLAIVDVSVPSQPQPPVYVDTPAYDVVIENNTAYVAAGLSGLAIVDITNPNRPDKPIFVDIPGEIIQLTVRDNTAYLLNENGGLYIVDVSDLQNPGRPLHFPTHDNPQRIIAADDYLYILDIEGLTLFDVGVRPPLASSVLPVPTPGDARDIVVTDGIAYIADKSHLTIINVEKPHNPGTPKQFFTTNPAHRFEITDKTAYVIDHRGEVEVVDLSSPFQPTTVEVDAWRADDNTKVVGDTIFAWQEVLSMFNRSAAGVVSNEINFGLIGYTRDVEIVGNTAYVAHADFNRTHNHGISMINIDKAKTATTELEITNTMTLIDKIPTPTAIAIGNNNLAYIAYEKGLAILDTEKSRSPSIIATAPSPSPATHVVADGDIAYLAHAKGIQIFDVSTGTPIQVGRYATSMLGARAKLMEFTAVDDIIYVVDGENLTILETPKATLSPNYVEQQEKSLLEYTVRWNAPHPTRHTVSCIVTGGHCEVIDIDRTTNTATVTWRLPSEPDNSYNDYEIAIAAGNSHFTAIARDRVRSNADQP